MGLMERIFGYIDVERKPFSDEEIEKMRFISENSDDIYNSLHVYNIFGNLKNIYFDAEGKLRERMKRKKNINIEFSYIDTEYKSNFKVNLSKRFSVTIGPFGLNSIIGQVGQKKNFGDKIIGKLYSWENGENKVVHVTRKINDLLLNHNWGQYVADSYLIDENAKSGA